jgi:hypothetical protein
VPVIIPQAWQEWNNNYTEKVPIAKGKERRKKLQPKK